MRKQRFALVWFGWSDLIIKHKTRKKYLYIIHKMKVQQQGAYFFGVGTNIFIYSLVINVIVISVVQTLNASLTRPRAPTFE